MDFGEIGKKIYDISKLRECRRYVIFRARCMLNHGRMKRLWDFFHSTPVLTKISDVYPFVYEQPQRAFFYHRSTFEERAALVEAHFAFLTEHIREDVLLDWYQEKNYLLWKGPSLDNEELALMLYYEAGQRKEGLLSVMLRLSTKPLYQIIFWIAPKQSGTALHVDWRNAGTEYGQCERDCKADDETLSCVSDKKLDSLCGASGCAVIGSFSNLRGHKRGILHKQSCAYRQKVKNGFQ